MTSRRTSKAHTAGLGATAPGAAGHHSIRSGPLTHRRATRSANGDTALAPSGPRLTATSCDELWRKKRGRLLQTLLR